MRSSRGAITAASGPLKGAMLVDAGPLVAIFDRGEKHHRICTETLSQLTGPLLTTWPAFTEAMYLLGEAGGWQAQNALWQIVFRSHLLFAELGINENERMRVLMEKYRDLPMDLADASLVAVAERENLQDIFTLDQTDFQVYRRLGKDPFRLWPEILA